MLVSAPWVKPLAVCTPIGPPEQFWDEFVMRGFARQAVKPQKLVNMCVFDWKQWMLPSLCQITLHTFQRAFLITKQEDETVLFFKKILMQKD